MENLVISSEGYIEIKKQIKDKLNETVHNFIIIGYYLKQVRDSGAYRNDGYKNMEEFAKKEYGLSPSTASRFMDINTQFSKQGNSKEILEEYKNFAYSKLQEMLTVSPEDKELVTEEMTVSQIREIKEVEKEEKQAAEEQEQKNLPLLQLAEPEERKPEEPKTEKEQKDESEYKDPLESVLTAFWMEKDNAELYTKADAGILTPEIAAEEICPSGSRIYRNGTNMMFFYDFDKGAKLRSIKDRKPVITSYTYQEILDKTKELKMSFEQTEESEIINAEQPENVLHSDKEAQPDKEPYQKTVATSQEKQEEPYITMDGQTSIADMQEIMPKELKETAANTQENTIDGEYRELMPHQDEKTKTEKSQYAQIEIKNALSYFEMEIRRMDGISSKETVKSRNYKIALECIRRCYQDIK